MRYERWIELLVFCTTMRVDIAQRKGHKYYLIWYIATNISVNVNTCFDINLFCYIYLFAKLQESIDRILINHIFSRDQRFTRVIMTIEPSNKSVAYITKYLTKGTTDPVDLEQFIKNRKLKQTPSGKRDNNDNNPAQTLPCSKRMKATHTRWIQDQLTCACRIWARRETRSHD